MRHFDDIERCRISFRESHLLPTSSQQHNLMIRLAPLIFVVLWSTGFIGAKYGTNHAEPFTFLALRFALTLAILLPAVFIFMKPDIRGREFLHSMVSGFLVHGVYLGAVFYAIDRGMPAGISALIVSLQPFVTALIAWFMLGERISLLKTSCFLLALFGVFLVLFPEFDLNTAIPGISNVTLVASIIAVVGISLGAVYQKRYVASLDLAVSTTGQFIGAAIPMLILAWVFETGEITWDGELIFAMAWLVLVLSIGTVVLLMYLIRSGSAASTASLFFLVPVSAALFAWVLFEENLGPVQITGGLIAVLAVGLASRLKE